MFEFFGAFFLPVVYVFVARNLVYGSLLHSRLNNFWIFINSLVFGFLTGIITLIVVALLFNYNKSLAIGAAITIDVAIPVFLIIKLNPANYLDRIKLIRMLTIAGIVVSQVFVALIALFLFLSIVGGLR